MYLYSTFITNAVTTLSGCIGKVVASHAEGASSSVYFHNQCGYESSVYYYLGRWPR